MCLISHSNALCLPLLYAGRIGRSYSDRCLQILTGLLGLKQDHITSGKNISSTTSHIQYSIHTNSFMLSELVFYSFTTLFVSLLSCYPSQRWCRQCVTWSGCVPSVATLCALHWKAARKHCRISRLDPAIPIYWVQEKTISCHKWVCAVDVLFWKYKLAKVLSEIYLTETFFILQGIIMIFYFICWNLNLLS